MGIKISEFMQKEIASYAQDHTLQDTADFWGVSKSTVSKYKQKWEKSITYIDPIELEMGIDVELEHTDDPQIAEQIAIDHLREYPDYYSRLEVMESSNFWEKNKPKIKPTNNPSKKEKRGRVGFCKLGNQMETDTLKRARFGFSITYSEPWQKGIYEETKKEGGTRKDAIKKIECEHNRIKNIIEKEYNQNVENYKELKIKI